MGKRVGIPRTLLYYYYYPQWNTFLRELGHEVVVSAPTSKRIVDEGVKLALNDACIPIKLYHGHVVDLLDKDVDAFFIPRYVSMDPGARMCPKFLGLPDIIRAKLEDQIPLYVDTKVDNRKRKHIEEKFYRGIAKQLGNNPSEAKLAFAKSQEVFEDFRRLLHTGMSYLDALQLYNAGKDLKAEYQARKDIDPFDHPLNDPEDPSQPRRLHFAVIGYVYLIYDDFINANLWKKMETLNVSLHTFDQVTEEALDYQTQRMHHDLFWMFSNRVVKGAFHFLHQDKIDGIIHITAFGCGPDAMTTKLIELEAKNRTHIPYMRVLLDEHTGDAGLMTRLESFTDMIRRRDSAAAKAQNLKETG